ncbi:MAG: hypothetical protein AAGD96_07630 [Chloroflexota bacterium]
MSDKTISELKESEQSTEQWSKYSQYTGGTVIILMGIGFLLSANFGFSMSYVWPMLFLVSVVFSAVQIFQDFQAGRDIGLEPIIGAAIMLLIGSAWLLNWNWGNVWPVFLIFGGLYAFGKKPKA